MAMQLSRLVVLAALVAARPAVADGLEVVATVKSFAFGSMPRHAIGDSRFVALSSLEYGDEYARVNVLDVSKHAVSLVIAPRATLAAKFGHDGIDPGTSVPPDGELVMYTGSAAGLFLEDGPIDGRKWYAELDPKTHAITRSVSVGDLRGGELLRFLGSDAQHQAAWFHLMRGDDIVLRRLDLATLAVTDVATVTRPLRKHGNGFEDSYTIVASRDFKRFAIAEYDERGIELSPRGRVFVIEPATGVQFSVPGLLVTYGLAFTPDAQYLFLGSSQTGTIARVDLAARAIDRTVAGPKLLHHLVVSPDGAHLYALASSSHYVAFDAPSLAHPHDRAHPAGLSAAAAQMFGDGFVTLDGRYFILGDHEDSFVIARFAD